MMRVSRAVAVMLMAGLVALGAMTICRAHKVNAYLNDVLHYPAGSSPRGRCGPRTYTSPMAARWRSSQALFSGWWPGSTQCPALG